MPVAKDSVAAGGRASLRAAPLVAMAIVLGTSGCAAMRQQSSKRCERCNSLCRQACTVKDEGYSDQADLLLNAALKERPADLDTRRQLAEALWECGRHADAIAEFRALAQLHPHDARLHERLAVMSWAVNQPENASRYADAALRLSPNLADALLVKARTQAAQEDLDAAVATYIRLTTVEPEMEIAKLELAEVHLQRGHANQACTLLRDVLLQSRQSPAQIPDVEWKLGLAYAAAHRWNEAANYLGRTIHEPGRTSADWQLLIVAKTRAGQDPAELSNQTLLASASNAEQLTRSRWTELRDQLLASATSDDDALGGVVRADYTRSAQVDRNSSRQ